MIGGENMTNAKHRAIRETRIDRVFNGIVIAISVLALICCLYPLYYTVIASLSDPLDVTSGRVFLWPVNMTFESYHNVIRYKSIWTGYRNTIFYTGVGTVYNLLLLLPASYALSRKEVKFKKFFMTFFVFTMFFSGGMVPTYLNIKRLGLLNSVWVMIIPGAFSVYNMLIVKTYYSSNFSESLAEAARVDGAGEFRIFFQLVMPLSTAIVAVMTLYHAVGHWNAYFSALIYLNDAGKYPLQLVLRQVLLLNSSISTDSANMSMEELIDAARRAREAETMKYAVIFVANAPVLALYPFVQKYFTKGVMVGSVKG